MELLLELFLTISLSLICTSLFIKLFSMHPTNTDKEDQLKQELEPLQMDKFQWVPLKEEVIKLQEVPCEGKSFVELHNIVGPKKEVQASDVEIVDKDVLTSLKCEDHEDVSFGLEEDGVESKMCEIEIESEEEVECKGENDDGMDDDWQKIGRKDFEELLGNKPKSYVDVDFAN